MEKKPLIKAVGVVKNYGSLRALDNFTADIPYGTIGLLGPNGAGKSTFIKAILSLININAGTIEVLGQRCTSHNILLRKRIGYMPEHDCLPQSMDAVELVITMGRIAGMSFVDAAQRAHQVLNYTGIGEERYRPIKTYSTGMKQRVKLAQAIVHDPDLLILDEPTVGMDPLGREEMLSLIQDISSSAGKNVLISTHILPDVEKLCSHVVMMLAGRVRAAGEINTLLGRDSNIYRIKVKCADENIKKFLAELKKKRIETDTDKGGSDGEYIIKMPDDATTSEIFKAATQYDISLRSLRKGRVSIEEVFLETYQNIERQDRGIEKR
ncbi:MAG: ABC transporter ATP-binding protein [Thermoplasmata archaeon]